MGLQSSQILVFLGTLHISKIYSKLCVLFCMLPIDCSWIKENKHLTILVREWFFYLMPRNRLMPLNEHLQSKSKEKCGTQEFVIFTLIKKHLNTT